MNERASLLSDDCIRRAAELRLAVHTLSTGARVVDAGVNVPGGFGAGLALARLCMGGVGHIEFTSLTIGGEAYPGVSVWTDHPAESCMASQYAGWAINPEGFFAMGSGPLRAKARVERELFGRLDTQKPQPGVLCSRADVASELPPGRGKAGVRPTPSHCGRPTASLREAQIVARVRDGLHMETLIRRHTRSERDGYSTAADHRAERYRAIGLRMIAFCMVRPAIRCAPKTRSSTRSRTVSLPPRRPITERLSTTSSSATTTTSIRSIRCCSVPQKRG